MCAIAIKNRPKATVSRPKNKPKKAKIKQIAATKKNRALIVMGS